MWRNREGHSTRPIFNDTFGNRYDYTLGTFYRGRREYLDDDPNKPNSLEPPILFKTKRQAKNSRLRKDLSLQKLRFQKKEEESSHPTKGIVKKFEGAKKSFRKSRLNETERPLSPAEWKESIQAGCKIWINFVTGEVSPVCPWNQQLMAPRDDLQSEEEYAGTGALVYDHSEYEEFVRQLSLEKRGPVKRTEIQYLTDETHNMELQPIKSVYPMK
jgi:hypothetical protein